MTPPSASSDMPTSDSQPELEALVDTSMAVALVVADHAAHAATVSSVGDLRLGLAGHAWYETYSVLTRLPGPARRLPPEVFRLLQHDFPASRFLDEPSAAALAQELPRLGIAGGSVYDALVGWAARSHGLPLLTRDARALTVYQALHVDAQLVEG